jgi:transposase
MRKTYERCIKAAEVKKMAEESGRKEEGRQCRGLQIAQSGRIYETPKGWIVPSQSGKGAYLVYDEGEGWKCNCPDCETRGVKCKHQWAVEFFLKEGVDEDGNKTVQKVVRVTYTQDWKAYNESQTNEIRLFDQLLKDLVASVEEPEREIHRGRPQLNVRDELFCAIQKVYSQLSQRRAYTLYRNAEEREQLTHVPHFNAVGKLLNQEDVTPLLYRLLGISALPLSGVETTFAPDSSGFRTSQFNQYGVEKYGTKKAHKWVKAHIFVGTKTNVVVSARITDEDGADSPQYKPMVQEAHNNGFNIKEIDADMAYSSRENYNLADEIGAIAYIPFKSNATGRSGGSSVWYKMYHYFQMNREEFMEHYHKRSNVESTFMMVKAKFGDKLKSKNWIAQVNELLCKLIAHNIVVLIHEMHELGINPNFSAYFNN